MQAAVHLPNTPILKIDDAFPIPKPGPGQVLVQVQASGVCHTDVSESISRSHPADTSASQVFLLSQFPDDARTYIMGHEVSGIAIEYAAFYLPYPTFSHKNNQFYSRLGSKVQGIERNKRYAVLAIGGCVNCVKQAKMGNKTSVPTHPTQPHDSTEDPTTQFLTTPFFGLGQNGGHAEYTVVDASMLIPVPDNVSSESAAVAADAGITAWHAIKHTAAVRVNFYNPART